MPDWIHGINAWNPISHLIEAMRAIVVSGFAWDLIGRSLASMAIMGLILQAATIWSFQRLAR